MPNRAFRFIHAADLHLELAPHGVAHVPDHLTDLFVDSAYAAAGASSRRPARSRWISSSSPATSSTPDARGLVVRCFLPNSSRSWPSERFPCSGRWGDR